MTKRRRRWILLTAIVIVLGGGFYFLRVHRVRSTVEKDGWFLQYTRILFACPVCTGRIERLECNSRPVPLPHFADAEDSTSVALYTPIGTFRTRSGHDRWWYMHGTYTRPEPRKETISDEDLARGYYDNTDADLTDHRHACPKKSTPAYWCRAMNASHDRWLDPQTLDELEW